MHIHQAIKTIGEKAPLLKPAADRAIKDKDHLIGFVDELLEQYNEPENGDKDSNKKRMDRIFGADVMQCIVEYANHINSWAEIKLANLQALEGNINLN